jgi:methylmalonyl-CoA/ethylmalonyl-CoA epimerase
MDTTLEMTAHHIGCLTDDMSSSIATYTALGFSNISPIYHVTLQQVSVCFIEIKNGFYLELVEFATTNTTLKKLFSNGQRYYHTGYLVNNIDNKINMLQSQGFYLVNKFSSEAFEGRQCAFLYSPQMQLIELIENNTK